MKRVLQTALAMCMVLSSVLLASGASAQDDQLRFIVISHGQAADPFWSVVQNGANQAGEDMDVSVEYQAPTTYDMVAMSQLIDAAVASEPDGIIISIPDGPALTPSIQKAIDAGIPVISINSGYETSTELGLFTHVGQTEYDAGFGGGQRMSSEGTTHAICLIHEAGNSGLEERCRGFEDGMAENGGTVEQLVVDLNNPTDAQQRIDAALTANPDINGIMALGPVGSTSAIAAVTSAGKSEDVAIATFDLSPEVIQGIQDGNVTFAIDQQQYLQGYLPVVFLTQFCRNGNTIAQDIVMTGPGYVDATNVDQVKDLIDGGTR